MDTTCSRCSLRLEERCRWFRGPRLRCGISGRFVHGDGICGLSTTELFDAERMVALLKSERMKRR